MSPRRRSDKRDLGPPGLSAEDLLADLVARLADGGLPLATKEERWVWLKAWDAAHPGHYVADPRGPGGQRWVAGSIPEWDDMPTAIARRDAITHCEVILRPEVWRPIYTREAQARSADPAAAEAEVTRRLEELAEARAAVSRRFALEGLVRPPEP